jgi:hypothetical protein
VWPSNLDVAASIVKVVANYSAHQGAAMTQYLLIEGLAAIALAVVVFALGRGARRRGADRLGQATVVAGLIPRWLGYTAAFLALALIASGAGYLLLNTTFAQAVFVSGPLLLAWVTGAGVALARTSPSGKEKAQ